MTRLYNLIDNDQDVFSDKKRLAKKMVPGPFLGGNVNVIANFPWTLTPKTPKVIDEVPYIKLKEFYLLDTYINQLFQAYGLTFDTSTTESSFDSALENAVQAIGVPSADRDILYQGLYDHDNPTGFTYTLPYFTETYLSTSNAWTATPSYQDLINLIKKIVAPTIGIGAGVAGSATAALGTLLAATPLGRGATLGGKLLGAGARGGAYGAILGAGKNIGIFAATAAEKSIEFASQFQLFQLGFDSPIGSLEDPAIDKPHVWNNTVPYSYSITFPLFNIATHDEQNTTKWNQTIVQNWELCHMLCYQNLYNKRNLFTGIPPVFYEITIPGVYYTKAGYVSELNILNAGNIRAMQLPIGENGTNKAVNVPDAYIVNMIVTDFFMPSKNFMDTVENPNNRGIVKAKKGDLTNISGDTPSINYNEGIGLPPEAFQYGSTGGGVK